MKYVIVTIKRETDISKPRMRYPVGYDHRDVNNTVRDGGLERGEDVEEALIRVNDTVGTLYDRDPDMRIVTKTEADVWLGQEPRLAAQPEERVTDVNRLIAIQTKKAVGVPLTQEDNDALDPDNAIRGINRVPKTTSSIFE